MTAELEGLHPQIAQLQQRLQTMQQERDRALISADQWRQRYEVEAQQRRRAAATADQTIASLRAELQQLTCRGTPLTPVGSAPNGQATQFSALLAERDRLREALEQEKAAHLKTRRNLINALNDALKTPERGTPPSS